MRSLRPLRRVLPLLAVVACAPRGEVSRPAAPVRESARVADMRALGEALFYGRGGCTTCHRLGADGDAETGPNLGVGPGFALPVARREHAGGDGFGYVLRSLVDPDAFVVPGYPAGKMPRVEEPPQGLDDRDLAALAAFVSAAGADAAGSPTPAPLSDARLDGAAREIAQVRAARGRRVAEKRMAELGARVRLDAGDPGRGAQVYVARGCAGCHGPPEPTPLPPPAASSEPRAVLDWLVGALPRHESCPDLGRPSELADLAAWLAAPRR